MRTATEKRARKPRAKPVTLSDMGGVFEFTPPRKARERNEFGDHSACIYFGKDRMGRVRAKLGGQSLSGFVCAAVDSALGLPADLAAKLEALAALKGTSAAELLAQLVRAAVKSV